MAKALLHELGKSLSFGRLSLRAKVLWPMLLASSDDQGRGLAEADAIKWYVCPNVPEITIDDVPGLLSEMAMQGMVITYDTDRGSVYQVVRWWEYQDLQWARPSKYDPPASWIDRIRYSNRGAYYAENWELVGGFDAGEREKPKAKPGEEATPEPPRKPPRKPPEVPTQPNLTQSNLTKEGEEPPNPSPEKNTLDEMHPALRIYEKNANCLITNPIIADRIVDIVELDPRHLSFWEQIVIGCVAKGYNPMNIQCMLDHYTQGRLPSGGPNAPPGTAPPKTPQPAIVAIPEGEPGWMKNH